MGVIDWDTGRELEFLTVDFFNLLIQQERCLGFSLIDAVQKILNQLESKVYCLQFKNYLRFFGLTAIQVNFFFGVTLIRYVSRASQYQAVLLDEQNDYLTVMKMYKDYIKI